MDLEHRIKDLMRTVESLSDWIDDLKIELDRLHAIEAAAKHATSCPGGLSALRRALAAK